MEQKEDVISRAIASVGDGALNTQLGCGGVGRAGLWGGGGGVVMRIFDEIVNDKIHRQI